MTRHGPRIQRLFEELLERNLDVIRPVFDPTSRLGYRYPDVDDILDTPSDETVKILESLAKDDILKRSFFDKLLDCKKCGSFNLRLSTHCTNCGSANIVRSRILQHSVCGYIGPEDMYKTGRGLVCPKCREDVQLIGIDHPIPRSSVTQSSPKGPITFTSLNLYSVLYKCNQCSELFAEADEKWHCLNCMDHFEKGESGEVFLHTYTLNKAVSHKLRMELKPKRKLEESLRRQGYEVESPARIQGKSGTEHELDLYAHKDFGTFMRKVVVGISRSDREVGLEEVLKLYVKAYDVDAEDIILFAIPRLSDEAKHFATYYRMKTYEAEDLEKIVSQLEPWKFLSEAEAQPERENDSRSLDPALAA